MGILKKQDLFMRLCEIRDRFMKNATNNTLAAAIGKVYIEGYLTGLLKADFITKSEYDELIKRWVQ